MAEKERHPGLTTEEFDVLGEYIRSMADEMGLTDWYLRLGYRTTDEYWAEDHDDHGHRSIATVVIDYGKRSATLYVAKDFRDSDPERQKVWIAHELAHVHMDGLDTACRELREPMGYVAWNAWWIMVRYHMEHAVNAFAEIIGPKLPDIRWPEKQGLESGHVQQS